MKSPKMHDFECRTCGHNVRGLKFVGPLFWCLQCGSISYGDVVSRAPRNITDAQLLLKEQRELGRRIGHVRGLLLELIGVE